jgi:hypothetical protein
MILYFVYNNRIPSSDESRWAFPPDMALQMAQELTNRGYLQEIGVDCEETLRGCPDCPVNSNCQVIIRRGFLSEKGRAAVSSIAMHKSINLKLT